MQATLRGNMERKALTLKAEEAEAGAKAAALEKKSSKGVIGMIRRMSSSKKMTEAEQAEKIVRDLVSNAINEAVKNGDWSKAESS